MDYLNGICKYSGEGLPAHFHFVFFRIRVQKKATEFEYTEKK